eukprot:900988-Prymnesium_polylepis.1
MGLTSHLRGPHGAHRMCSDASCIGPYLSCVDASDDRAARERSLAESSLYFLPLALPPPSRFVGAHGHSS